MVFVYNHRNGRMFTLVVIVLVKNSDVVNVLYVVKL